MWKWIAGIWALLRSRSTIGLGLVGVVVAAGILIYDYSNPSPSHERDHFILIAIVGLLLPIACALVFIFDAAVEWLGTGSPDKFAQRIADDVATTVWSDGESTEKFAKRVAQEVAGVIAAGFEVKKFDNAIEFAEFRSKIIMEISARTLSDPIYCTSHLNLFAKPDGPTQLIRDTVAEINKPFFKRLSELALLERRGGLKLILQYRDDEAELLEKELNERLKLFWEVARELKKPDWADRQFDVTRMTSMIVKDYFVIGDHIFKTIRKTHRSNEATSYIYIRSADIASSYREWMEDLFNYGHVGPHKTTDKESVFAEFNKIKQRLNKNLH